MYSYIFTQAYDGLNEGCTSVIVTVDDINDNEPVFPLDDITVSIPENTPPETVVLTAMAVDADIGSNGDITYSLLPLISDFDIDGKRIVTCSRIA